MIKPDTNFKLLTFYKFVDIDNAREVAEEHKTFCQGIGMRGRIYIGEEGISATVTVNQGQLMAYKLYLNSIPYFRDIPDIEIKANDVDSHKFDKMIVKYRKEIVVLGAVYQAKDIENSKVKMSIEEFKNILDSEDDSYVILDMRNNYEYKLGHFKNAIPAGTFHFRDLDKHLSDYKQQFQDKKIVMYCTGGIRCEKAAIMLEKSGLEGVFQLDGGVVKYTNVFDDGNWLGNLYTFDGRVSTKIGSKPTHFIISECHYTGEPAEEMFNCRFTSCNQQFISSFDEFKKHFGFCSEKCVKDALNSLLIKNDFTIDNLNYKQLRGRIKSHPNETDSIRQIINNHVSKHLEGIEFNHKVPVNENEL